MQFFSADSRLGPVLLAYATTGMSKVATVAVQLIALPIAAAELGVERFGAMLTLAAIASFLTIPGQGLSPTASLKIATALGKGKVQETACTFWQLMILAFVAGMLLFVAVLGTVQLGGDKDWLFGDHELPILREMSGGLVAVAFYLLIYYVSAPADGTRAAHAQNHVSNLFAFVGSCGVLTITAIGGLILEPSIWLYFSAIFITPPLAQLFNLLLFILTRSRELGLPRVAMAEMLGALKITMSYCVAQSGYALHQHGLVYLSSSMIGLTAAAIVGSAIRLFSLMQSSLLSLANPILPLISKANAAGDRADTLRLIKILLGVGVLLSLSIGVAFAFGGSTAMKLWLGPQAAPDQWVAMALGLFFIGYSVSHLGYIVLLAMHRAGSVSLALLASGVVALAIDVFVLSNLASMVFTGALAMVLINGISVFHRIIASYNTENSHHGGATIATKCAARFPGK